MTAAAAESAAAAAALLSVATVGISGSDNASISIPGSIPPSPSLSPSPSPAPSISPSTTTATTTATTNTPFLPVAKRVCTPLSLFLDAAPPPPPLFDADAEAAVATIRQRYLAMPPAAAAAAVASGRPVEDKSSAQSSAAGRGGIISAAPLFQRANARAARGGGAGGRQQPPDLAAAGHHLHLASPPAAEDAPLRTSSVQPHTALAHPRPILKHPVPDLPARSASVLSNIAQLEATAERLSMTSSIDDAIRDLHGALKRSDSRRSSILAASIRAASADENAAAAARLRRHPSSPSSVVARHRGYSPAAYVMSPSNSLTGRMRSASKTDHDVDSILVLSRHGPGKSSVRSVRSAKPSLAEISESEPISLTQHVLDEADADADADAVPPRIARVSSYNRTSRILEQDTVDASNTDEFHQMLEGGFGNAGPDLALADPDQPHYQPETHYQQTPYQPTPYQQTPYQQTPYQQNEPERPPTSNSTTTFQQAQDAFVDFDGVHCEADADPEVKPELQLDASMPASPPMAEKMRPESYYDQQTGQQMLYYPARVPAMLNLPPKLSSKPKTAQRNPRRSQVMSVMMDPKPVEKRQSVVPDLDKSWLPDPLSGHRNSFAALSTADGLQDVEMASFHPDDESAPRPAIEPESAPELRRPQRLSRMDPDQRKSKVPQLDNLPAQLRASVFFELPSESPPEIEIIDGSAMATLDSILDASANAPVSAFTDHAFAGKLGTEVYGKQKKHKSHASVPTLNASSLESKPKKLQKRSSAILLNKRSSSHLAEDKNAPRSASLSMQSVANGEHAPAADEDNVAHAGADEEKDAEGEDADEDEQEVYQGPPTTLLAELQMRKQQQKQRVRNPNRALPEGMRATLLEMDAVAETQRKQRQNKRVNLAWEDHDGHLQQNASDDDDVPLAIIAAMQQGAKNLADLERPLGLMERREMEDNEPLSHRQARLQGHGSSLFLPKRHSVMSLPVTRMAEMQPAPPPAMMASQGPPEEPTEDENEEETLGARRRRLTQLPKARPVSSAFSMELLGQFEDVEAEEKPTSSGKENKAPDGVVEDETLGQRRRRLQAEREAREREMSYSNLVGEPAKKPSRRVSMADVLAVHQKREPDRRILDERRRLEEQQHLAEQEAKMAAIRSQMPGSLTGPSTNRTGAFQGGVYNDGLGGRGPEVAKSSPALHVQNFGGHRKGSSMVLNNGAPMREPMRQSSYNSLRGFGAMNNANMGVYGYAGGMLQPPGMPMSMSMGNTSSSMDRVERWRQSVQP